MDLQPSEEVDPCQVRSTALGAFEHTLDRTQGAVVERRPSQPASHVDALAGPGDLAEILDESPVEPCMA
jgi:hypothetical protein